MAAGQPHAATTPSTCRISGPHNRLTLQGALRYEHAWSFFPEGLNGLLADSVFGGPACTLPAAKGVTGYNDIAPRMGMAYDVFGNGKTAIKVNLSK